MHDEVFRSLTHRGAFDVLAGCRDCYSRIDMLRGLDWTDELRSMLEASQRVGRWIETGKW